MRALVVGLGSIGRRHARNWASLGLGPVIAYRHLPSAPPQRARGQTGTQPRNAQAEAHHRAEEAEVAEPHHVAEPGQLADRARVNRPHADDQDAAAQRGRGPFDRHTFIRSTTEDPHGAEMADAARFVSQVTGETALDPVSEIVQTEFDDLDEALRQRPDVVFICNPTSLHLDAACRAVQAGAHVFIEKPISHTLAGLDELLTLAEKSRRHVMVGYNLRFHPGLVRLRDLVRQGAVGKVVSARAEVGEYLPDWHPWEDYRVSYSGRRELGGGAVLTLSHDVDALCWVLGAPSTIFGMAAHASQLEIDTEDVAELVLQFADGAIGSVHVDYVRRPPRRNLEIVGEQGVLRLEYDTQRVMQYQTSAGQWQIEELDPRFDRNDMYLAELRHLVGCVQGEIERPLIDGEQGAAILAIVLAGLRSSTEGRRIDLHAQGPQVGRWLTSLG